MPRININAKGKYAEVEFTKWLKKNLDIDAERIYNQASGFSSDISTENFLFEIKRREQLDLSNWYHQVIVSKKHHSNPDVIPVVAFRQNRCKWEFLIPSSLLFPELKGFIRLQEHVFIAFAKTLIE